jgi:1-acyl-sn-glycerol-3-phosphate acyltransferase
LLAFFRIIIITIAFLVVTTAACIYSLFRPFHPNNVYLVSIYLGKIIKLFGVQVEIRLPDSVKTLDSVVYVANHQNTYDIFTISNAVRKNTVSVGKKSLKWIPFFGQMYWLTGNILIDRNNTNKAMDTITQTADRIKNDGLSVWLFPEGTRSSGNGLQPFKTGAFRTAALANVPIVPVCMSNTNGNIKLNRWNNGKIIIEYLPAIMIEDNSREGIREVTNKVHDMILDKVTELSIEANSVYPPYKKMTKSK